MENFTQDVKDFEISWEQNKKLCKEMLVTLFLQEKICVLSATWDRATMVDFSPPLYER